MSSQARTVFEVLRLQNREWVRQALYGSGDVMESRVLTGFKLNISDIFRGA